MQVSQLDSTIELLRNQNKLLLSELEQTKLQTAPAGARTGDAVGATGAIKYVVDSVTGSPVKRFLKQLS